MRYIECVKYNIYLIWNSGYHSRENRNLINSYCSTKRQRIVEMKTINFWRGERNEYSTDINDGGNLFVFIRLSVRKYYTLVFGFNAILITIVPFAVIALFLTPLFRIIWYIREPRSRFSLRNYGSSVRLLIWLETQCARAGPLCTL